MAHELAAARSAIHAQKSQYYLPLDDGEEMIYCCLERFRGERTTAFHLHREDTGQFIIAASCSTEQQDGVFKFHTVQDSHLRGMADIPESRDSAVFLGIMNLNFLGTEFVLKDHRSNKCESMVNELAMTVYDSNISGRCPNSMRVVVPRYTFDAEDRGMQTASLSARYATVAQTKNRSGLAGGLLRRHFPLTAALMRATSDVPAPRTAIALSIAQAPAEFTHKAQGSRENPQTPRSPTVAEDEHIVDYSGIERDDQLDLACFATKKPIWNDEIGAWTLNFNGRAKRASKKNFLLVPASLTQRGENLSEKESSKTYLRFGKMSKNRFSLDFRDPCSPIVALSVALTTFAKKRVVT
ncbi:tubby C-terminal-like domain-containing protein [Pelagophyceae sp. CCMP2097]|nr:tubby C-terminal-like domain-containing protein [Pelagophyceae sp. CCMP2097]|mmetsp:Transcript_680/g.2390  ORF Transcript_680/g.2390 Transcript_680/m.2390 type:complete len:354 (+) Transcript_680:68-1129(+)